RDEESELVREVEVRLVIGCRAEEDAAALVGLDVVADCAVAATLPVPQVVALVDDDHAEAAKSRQFGEDAGDREDPASQPVLVAVVLPHRDEVLRTEDQRLQTE